MSAISEDLAKIQSAIYGEEVRGAIHDAISQCYNDVSNPTLQTEAIEAAVQVKIDEGEMAALTIADGTLTGAKLADGTIPTAKIADGAVTSAKLGNGAVTTAKIADGAITAAKIASGAVTTDTTLSQSGMPADAKAVGDAVTNLREDLTQVIDDITGPNKNLLYYYPWTTNGAKIEIDENSITVEATSASTYRSARVVVPVDNEDDLTLSYSAKSSDAQTTTAASIRLGFSEDGTNITWGSYVSTSPYTINVRGKKYLVIMLIVDQVTVSVGTKSTFSQIQLEVGDTATTFSNEKYDGIDRHAQAQIEAIEENIPTIVADATVEIGVNKFNPSTTEIGFIGGNTGAINPATDYFTSDFIDVSNFQIGYAFTPNARKILFYDENRNAITESYHINETPAGVIELNADYKYMRLSWYHSYTNVMVCDANVLPDYEPYEKVAKDGVNYLNSETMAKVQQMVGNGGKSAQIASFLNGKTIAVFGDSIMYGAGSNAKGAVDLLAEKYNMTVAKYCVSGSTMGIRTDDPSYTVDEVHHIAKQVRNAIAANITPDLIVFNGGTNDIGGQIPIGTMTEVYTEPSSESYFADGFETVAYLLMKNFVGVPMIYMRAHNMSSRSYTGQVEYGELGNRIAEKWGIRTVDMYKHMNTQLAEYRTAYLADYTHPNEAGYNKYYLPALEDFIFRELV